MRIRVAIPLRSPRRFPQCRGCFKAGRPKLVEHVPPNSFKGMPTRFRHRWLGSASPAITRRLAPFFLLADVVPPVGRCAAGRLRFLEVVEEVGDGAAFEKRRSESLLGG